MRLLEAEICISYFSYLTSGLEEFSFERNMQAPLNTYCSRILKSSFRSGDKITSVRRFAERPSAVSLDCTG